ncbi:tyrosine-type recombinase/integrase [archaeon]|nr:tyrosine-type recombinase/integrase [archaeon]
MTSKLRGIHDFDKRMRRSLRHLEKVKILDSNRELITEFHNYLLAKGISKARVSRYVRVLCLYAELIGDKKFKELTKKDLVGVVGTIESRDYTNWTKVTYKTMLKKFITWLEGDEEVPDKIKWVNLTCKKTKKLPEEILTQEEVKKLIECAPNERDKAFIATLYESGCRIGEVGNLQIKHIQFDKYGCVLMVNGKTGQRRVRVMAAVPYLADWLNKHPDRRPDAALWVALRPYPPERLRYDTIRHNLRKIAKLAAIDKKVNPHAFRHARATHLCNHLTEAQMKEYFGWTQDSAMASVYIHLSGRDVDKALLKMHGIVIDEEGKDEAIKLVPCDRCGQGNAPTNKYCGKCGLILDVKEALEVERLNREKDEVMNLILSDPDIKRLAIEKLKVRHG